MILVAGILTFPAAHGETLYQRDGVVLEGTARIEVQEAAVCQVLAEHHSPEAYERMKANHGQPLYVWRLRFIARNSSGRSLDHLTAQFSVASEAPPCTNWSEPLGNFVKPVLWADNFQVLQEPDGMEPDAEATATVFVLAFHDRQPKFESWTVDYRFAAVGPGDPSGASNVDPYPVNEGRARAPADRLSPEIRADRYLLKAEQAVRDQDSEGARLAMELLRAVQEEHELEPESEDRFRFAGHGRLWGSRSLRLSRRCSTSSCGGGPRSATRRLWS